MSERLAEALLREVVACHLVERAGGHARLRGGDRAAVRLEDERVDLLVELRGLRRDDVPRHVRAIAVQLDAHVDENRLLAVPDRVIGHVVAFGRVLADADDRLEGLALAALDHEVLDDARHLALGHAGLELRLRGGPDLVVELLGGAELLLLVRRLHRAERLDVRIDVHELRLRMLLHEPEVARGGHRRLVTDLLAREDKLLDVLHSQPRRKAVDHRHVAEVGMEDDLRRFLAWHDQEARVVAVDAGQGADIGLVVDDGRRESLLANDGNERLEAFGKRIPLHSLPLFFPDGGPTCHCQRPIAGIWTSSLTLTLVEPKM